MNTLEALQIKPLISKSWNKVTNFKGTYWLGTLIVLLSYFFISALAMVFLFLANYGFTWLILSGLIFLGGLFFLFVPLQVGLFRLSILHMRNEPVKAKFVFQYLNGSIVFKIGMIGLASFFISLLLSIIPSTVAQILVSILLIEISALTLLAWLYVADKNENIDPIFTFVLNAFKRHWWPLWVFAFLGYVVLILGVVTLGIALVWLAPWYNNLWGAAYNQINDSL